MKQVVQEGTIQRRDIFLNELSEKLGRTRKKEISRPVWSVQPQWNVLKNKTEEELLSVLEKQCDTIHTKFIRTNLDTLHNTMIETLIFYKAKSVITWSDARFKTFGIENCLELLKCKGTIDYMKWDKQTRKQSVQFAERADVGITFSDITLAESATVVLFNDAEKGRSVSLLPKTHIVIIPKSTLVPRLTQATKIIREKLQAGETIASCINFISGPSNSADIEMNLVVGVHGPLHVAYIVVEDC